MATEPHSPRLAALLDAPTDPEELDAVLNGSAYARASGMGGDAMAACALGDRWKAAADALATDWPASARRALAWSGFFYRRHHAHWTANLPASRFEDDGHEGLEAANALRASLIGEVDPGEAPRWARDLLGGRVPRSLPAPPGTGEPRAFAPLLELLLAAAPRLETGDRRWT
jgi:hypothetical protein